MNKKLSVVFVFILIICVITLSACDELSGASAYEIAVKNGFVGTEAEWLASLKGTNGLDGTSAELDFSIEDFFEAALQNGFEGSFLDFLSSYFQNETIANDNVFAVSKALLSSVRIHCLFGSAASAGSGVIYKLDNNGNAYIITNFHVVYDKKTILHGGISQNISVFVYGMENLDYAIPAAYVGGSMTYDIAVLKVSASDILKNNQYRAVSLCPNNYVTVGQTAIAIGNPEGKGISATSGVVSVDSETITMTAADDATVVDFRVMRVDTAINSGNSGGGLFNSSGELIGIVNAKTVNDAIENIGYALPMSTATAVADNIIANCADGSKTKMQRCLLGVTTVVDSSKLVFDEATSITSKVETIKVYEISESSLVINKLAIGDFLKTVTFRGKTYTLDRSYVLVDLMLGATVGETITLGIERNGTAMSVEITLTPACVVEVV